MKKILWMVLALSFSSFNAEAVEVSWSESDSSEMELEVRLSPEEATPETLKVQKKNFSRVPIRNEGFQSGREGLPEIPVIHRWVAVTESSQYRFEIIPGNYKTYKDVWLYPAQPDVVENETAPFKLNPAAYLQNRWYGDVRFALGKRAKLGNVTILPVAFFPAAYNPRKKELRVYENIRVRLISMGAKPVEEEPPMVSQFVAEQVAHLTLNGAEFLRGNVQTARSKKFLIAYSKPYASAAQEISQLYQALGIEVSSVEILPGMKPASVKEIIGSEYLKWNLDAVLFFGDESSIPLRDFGGKTGDFSYGLVSGTDEISDVAVGRYPVKNEIQSRSIVNKVRKYQELFQSGYRNKRVMLTAHKQSYPGKYTGNMEEVRTSPNTKNLEFNTQYGGEKATNATLVGEAQRGYAIINYRGHGSSSSWSSWGSDGASFSATQVKSLPGEAQSMAFVFNVACTNGAIQNSSPALVERELFPNEDPSSFQGAVGTFGATAPSLTEVNHRFNKNLFEALQSAPEVSIGSVYTLANNQLTKDNGGYATSNTRMYVLFSDPLLVPWID